MAFHSWTGLTDPEPFVLQISSYFPIYLPLIPTIQYCTDNVSITSPFPIVFALDILLISDQIEYFTSFDERLQVAFFAIPTLLNNIKLKTAMV